MSDAPEPLRDLDRSLDGIRFEPRASLGPEIVRRAREAPAPAARPPSRHRFPLAGLAAAATVAAAFALGPVVPFGLGGDRVTIDRCCYDLDGGGEEDDGVLIEAERDDRVHRLRVYEDLDGSRSWSDGDLLRLDRGAEPAVHGSETAADLVTIERCCLDFDGGGPSDDGLLVIGVPPDRVVMAAIYERRATAGGATWRAPLR